jgi:hypothetical protein
MMMTGAVGEISGRRNGSTLRKPTLVPLCSPQSPHVGGMSGRRNGITLRKPTPVSVCPPKGLHNLTQAGTKPPLWEVRNRIL